MVFLSRAFFELLNSEEKTDQGLAVNFGIKCDENK